MPDGRLRNATAYSTNKSTLANRRRLSSMAPAERTTLRLKTSEYQSIWQLLNRVSRKDDYRRATHAARRTMLQNSCRALMEKRRREGKTMCQTDTETMIDKHLKKESVSRSYSRSTTTTTTTPTALPNLKGIALDPSPHDPFFLSPPTTPSGGAFLEEGLQQLVDDHEEEEEAAAEATVSFSLQPEEEEGQAPNTDLKQSLDAHQNNHSHPLPTTLSTLTSELRSLRQEVSSLKRKFESLQQQQQQQQQGDGSAQFTATTEEAGGSAQYDPYLQQLQQQMYPLGFHSGWNPLPVWGEQQQQEEDEEVEEGEGEQGYGTENWIAFGQLQG